jgi:hypothetical protein
MAAARKERVIPCWVLQLIHEALDEKHAREEKQQPEEKPAEVARCSNCRQLEDTVRNLRQRLKRYEF